MLREINSKTEHFQQIFLRAFCKVLCMNHPSVAGIESKIYLIRNQKVMLDSDLAFLYEVSTRTLNQAVRRNIERFPPDFAFQLIDVEWEFLKSQIVTSKIGRGGKQKLPLVFTEFGVAMLSSVLRSNRAIQVNIAIMRTFGRLRQVLESNKTLAKKLFELEKKYDGQFHDVFSAIRELMSERSVPRKRIIGLGRKEE